MTQNTNKISICVPVYNRPDLTLRALKSVLYQTVKPFEVLVLNDCSTEDMRGVEEFCQANGFTYQSNIKNLGLIENINKTISLAQGDFWCVLHNDDLLSPFYVERCLDFLVKYPTFDIWATNGCAINSTDKVIAEFRLFNQDTTIKKREGFKILYRNGYYTLLSIIGSTIYRTSFIKNHLFDPAWGNEADLDNALYFLANYDVKYIDTAIYFARMHSNQESKKLIESTLKLEQCIHRRISLYQKYALAFSIKNFLTPIYIAHLLQLLIRYRLSYKQSMAMLKIARLKAMLSVLFYAPIMLVFTLKHKLSFAIHKKEIERCLIKQL